MQRPDSREPGVRLIAFHFSSGDAFFSGAGLLVLASALRLVLTDRRRWVARVIAVAGMLFIALSATPLPWWFYSAWAVIAVVWLAAFAGRHDASKRRVRAATAALVLWTMAGVLWEATYRFPKHSPPMSAGALYVLGDSLASGMQESPEEPTWPRQLQERFRVPVRDLSHVGATTKMAQQQALGIDSSGGVVLIEVGGNDLLGGTTAAQFAEDLEGLLRGLRQPGRTLVMLELPLPPFYNRFGQIQRELADRYDVVLIPKREFAAAIFAPGTTLDGLHFSEAGHARMAEMVWQHIRVSFESRR